jgi:hypothetical protein
VRVHQNGAPGPAKGAPADDLPTMRSDGRGGQIAWVRSRLGPVFKRVLPRAGRTRD